MNQQELDAIVLATLKMKGNEGAIPNARWWPVFLYVVWNTGMRLQDVLALPRRGHLKERRHRGSVYATAFPAWLTALIEATIPKNADRLVPAESTQEQLFRTFKSLKRKANVKTGYVTSRL